MAAIARQAFERRLERRLSGGGPRFAIDAVLRPGQAVVLVNISRHAALVESGSRLRPGTQTELQLTGCETRACVRVRVERCHVARLDPLQYHGVVVFDDCVDIGAAAEGSE